MGGLRSLSAFFKKKIYNASDMEISIMLNLSTNGLFQMENYVLLSILYIFLIGLFTLSFYQNDDKEGLLSNSFHSTSCES